MNIYGTLLSFSRRAVNIKQCSCVCKNYLAEVTSECMQYSTYTSTKQQNTHISNRNCVKLNSNKCRHFATVQDTGQQVTDGDKDLALFPNPGNINIYVPKSKPVSEEDVNSLQRFINDCQKLIVLTGAGISTESGIPDYRSEGVGLYARSTNRPVQYQDFVKYPEIRKRYWARNYVGWSKFGYFLPNISHKTLTHWEEEGLVHWLVTQNVDALHYKAGSNNVTELHGSAHRVMCLNCDHKMPRTKMQEIIDSYNPDWSATSEEMAPDADVQLSQEQIDGFVVPPCPNCGGALKPEITFFGDNVKKSVVEFVHQKVRESDALLLAGTSLQVYSGYRFAAAAQEQGKPIAIINIGPTRADKLATLKIDAKCGDVLPNIQL